MSKKILNKSKKMASKKVVTKSKKKVTAKSIAKAKLLKSKVNSKQTKSKVLSAKKDLKVSLKQKIQAKATKVKEKSTTKNSKSPEPQRKVGRPRKDAQDLQARKLIPIVAQEPRKRGRPPKIKTPEQIEAELNAVPKKRGRKSKAELEAIAQGLDPRTVLQNQQSLASQMAASYPGGVIPLGQPIKRKRGRPRKNDQYGMGGAVLTSELMARGIRRFGVPLGGTSIPIAKYSWSAESAELLTKKITGDNSLDLGKDSIITDEVEFEKGDKVVYPAHGLGVIQNIQSRTNSGAVQKFYLISIIETGMKIMVPVSQANTVGLRRVVDHSTVDRVYAILKDKNVAIDNQTWNRRYREYSQKIKTGSVLEIASVIRDLTVLKIEKELSFNERRMLDTAQGLLVKELSIAKSSTEDLIKEELEQICQF